ncbi:TPA: AAA family ATPase [Vibrio vulnificus]|nr:AAA family ATPase [Vibrio navarrensis]HAS6100761.1 AAA family ATPase [Vibrio vulnificus]
MKGKQDTNFITFSHELDFERKKVCLLYGPNGTGKTSLSEVLNQELRRCVFYCRYDLIYQVFRCCLRRNVN